NSNAEKVILATKYNYIMREEQNLPVFEQNNHVSRETVFGNYFAYDDNSVEGSISTYNGRGIRARIAVEYELAKEDSLQAVRIIFPYMIQDYSHKSFNLLIFIGELKNTPDYIIRDLNPIRGNAYQPFTEYKITDFNDEGILLPAGKVYIGWEHPKGTDKDYIPVGFDKNHPEANAHMYYHLGDGWLNVAESSPDLQGAVAMRLVVGQDDVLTHNPAEIEDLSAHVYPNPASNEIKIASLQEVGPIMYQLFNVQGQLRKSGNLSGDRIQVADLEPGYYTVILINSNQKI